MAVVLRQSRRTFAERLDFVTSVGFGDGPESRRKLGLTGGGPQLVITDLGVLRPDPDTMELVLTGIYAGVSPQQVRDNTGWDLVISADLTDIPPPSEAELTALRDMLAGGLPSAAANADGVPSARRPAVPVIKGASS